MSASLEEKAPGPRSRSPDQPLEETLDIRLRRFTDALAKGVGQLGSHPRYLTIAVLPFGEHGERTAAHDLGVLLSYSVRAAMALDYGLPVVPPPAIREAMKKLPPGKALGPEEAQRVGRAVHARGVIMGRISDSGDHFAISATVLAAGGSQTPVEHRLLRVEAAEMLGAADQARILRTRPGALWRSSLAPGWGQFYNRDHLKGVVIIGAEASLLTAALVFQILGARAESRYDQDYRQTAGEGEKAEDCYVTRNILLSMAAGVWVYGALDAWMSGADPDETPTLSASLPDVHVVPLATPATDGPVFLGGAVLGRF